MGIGMMIAARRWECSLEHSEALRADELQILHEGLRVGTRLCSATDAVVPLDWLRTPPHGSACALNSVTSVKARRLDARDSSDPRSPQPRALPRGAKWRIRVKPSSSEFAAPCRSRLP